MLKGIAIGAAMSLAAASAHAETATFRFSGTCDGKDMWNSWQVSGHRSSPDAFVRPWEPHRVRIDRIKMVKLQEPVWRPRQIYLNLTMSWFMLGTTIPPDDALAWLAPGETSTAENGRGTEVPSQSEARATVSRVDENGNPYVSGDLFDLHGQCYGGGGVTILVTIRYTPLR
jgi:hypothetical protein